MFAIFWVPLFLLIIFGPLVYKSEVQNVVGYPQTKQQLTLFVLNAILAAASSVSIAAYLSFAVIKLVYRFFNPKEEMGFLIFNSPVMNPARRGFIDKPSYNLVLFNFIFTIISVSLSLAVFCLAIFV
ncbi:MAG: hypothetical protein GF390_02275 [Candidatus Pacebacteria bacterium]|nr:hypothetical protein [Candidatus Paceibacterota bacterium]